MEAEQNRVNGAGPKGAGPTGAPHWLAQLQQEEPPPPPPPNNPAFILGQGNSVVEFLHENTFYTDSKYHGEGEINQEAAAEQFLRRK